MIRRSFFEIGMLALIVNIAISFTFGRTIIFAEEANPLPGYVRHLSVKVIPGQEQEAIKYLKARDAHNQSMGRILSRKYIEKTDEGSIIHWIVESPDRAAAKKLSAEKKVDQKLQAIKEKYAGKLFIKGTGNASKWEAICAP